MYRRLGVHPGADLALPLAATLAEFPMGRATAAMDVLRDAHLVEMPTADRFRPHDLVRRHMAAVEPGDTGRPLAGAALPVTGPCPEGEPGEGGPDVKGKTQRTLRMCRSPQNILCNPDGLVFPRLGDIHATAVVRCPVGGFQSPTRFSALRTSRLGRTSKASANSHIVRRLGEFLPRSNKET